MDEGPSRHPFPEEGGFAHIEYLLWRAASLHSQVVQRFRTALGSAPPRSPLALTHVMQGTMVLEPFRSPGARSKLTVIRAGVFSQRGRLSALVTIVTVLRGTRRRVWSAILAVRSFFTSDLGPSQGLVLLVAFSGADPFAASAAWFLFFSVVARVERGTPGGRAAPTAEFPPAWSWTLTMKLLRQSLSMAPYRQHERRFCSLGAKMI